MNYDRQDTQGVQIFHGHGQGQSAGKVFQKHLAAGIPHVAFLLWIIQKRYAVVTLPLFEASMFGVRGGL